MYGMVFTQVFRRLAYLAVFGLLTSCTAYRTLQVEILQPAQLEIGQGKHIALLERNISYTPNPTKFLEKYHEISRKNLFFLFSSGMSNVFTEAGRFDSILPLVEQKTTYLKDKTLPPPLSADSVRLICKEYNIDYLVSIELVYYAINATDQMLSNNWYIRLYKDGEVLDSVILRDNLTNGYNEGDELLNYIVDGARDQGMVYARRLVPYWEQVERRVYNKGKVLGLGDVFFCNKNIDEAIKVWSGAQNISTKMAVRAGINLAWIYEDAGDFEGAADILQQTYQLAREKDIVNDDITYLLECLKNIKLRIEKRQLLEQQMAPIGN